MYAIRIFLAFDAHKNFKVYQMDVKSTLLNGQLEKEVYIEQIDGFKLLGDLEMIVDSIRCFMDSSKFLELGMKGWIGIC